MPFALDLLQQQHLRRFLNSCVDSVSPIMTMAELWSITSAADRHIIESLLALKPQDYGFRGESIAVEPLPSDIICGPNRTSDRNDEYHLTHEWAMPQPVHLAFLHMQQQFSQDQADRQLLVGSAYRSPAFQVIVLVHILVKVYNFDIAQTLRRVALPAYSQHCSVSHTAIDMLNIDGLPTDEDAQAFKDTVEYAWLREHAGNFGFLESYPETNPWGIMWEPWHWQYRP